MMVLRTWVDFRYRAARVTIPRKAAVKKLGANASIMAALP